MSVLGTGDIAKAIKDRHGFTIFAKGFAKRSPLSDNETNREIAEIEKAMRSAKHFVYFSSLSVYYNPDDEYTMHKILCEAKIKSMYYITKTNYTIIRIGNITWGNNPNTLINYVKARIAQSKPVTIRNVYRYLVDPVELNHWMGMIRPGFNSEMNIPGKRYKVETIVDLIKKGKL